MNTPRKQHNYARLPALIKAEQLLEMQRLADAHNRTFAGEIRHALDFYIAANNRQARQQEARSA